MNDEHELDEFAMDMLFLVEDNSFGSPKLTDIADLPQVMPKNASFESTTESGESTDDAISSILLSFHEHGLISDAPRLLPIQGKEPGCPRMPPLRLPPLRPAGIEYPSRSDIPSMEELGLDESYADYTTTDEFTRILSTATGSDETPYPNYCHQWAMKRNMESQEKKHKREEGLTDGTPLNNGYYTITNALSLDPPKTRRSSQ
jgi:hypothetical protein